MFSFFFLKKIKLKGTGKSILLKWLSKLIENIENLNSIEINCIKAFEIGMKKKKVFVLKKKIQIFFALLSNKIFSIYFLNLFFPEQDIFEWLQKKIDFAIENQPSVILIDDFELIAAKRKDRDGIYIYGIVIFFIFFFLKQ